VVKCIRSKSYFSTVSTAVSRRPRGTRSSVWNRTVVDRSTPLPPRSGPIVKAVANVPERTPFRYGPGEKNRLNRKRRRLETNDKKKRRWRRRRRRRGKKHREKRRADRTRTRVIDSNSISRPSSVLRSSRLTPRDVIVPCAVVPRDIPFSFDVVAAENVSRLRASIHYSVSPEKVLELNFCSPHTNGAVARTTSLLQSRTNMCTRF